MLPYTAKPDATATLPVSVTTNGFCDDVERLTPTEVLPEMVVPDINPLPVSAVETVMGGRCATRDVDSRSFVEDLA